MDNPNTFDSGYQQANAGTYFRDRTPNTTPSGTTTPDLYEPVTATQQINGGTVTNFTLDDQTRYVPMPAENLSYDLEGNLLTISLWLGSGL